MNQEEQLEAILQRFGEEIDPHGWADGDMNKAVSAITALIQEAVNEGRVAELRLFARETAALDKKETWEDWSWRAARYLEKRIKELSGGSNNE